MTREHWLQGVAIVAPLGALGLITMVSTTWILSNQIAGVRADAMTSTSVLSSKLAADEERIAAMERDNVSRDTRDTTAQAALRGAIDRVIDSLADVRVSVGTRSHVPK